MNAVFVKLVNMSVAAGWLILAVLVLRLLLKKAPRWITCLLWAMVAVRLVCPISLQSPVSAYQVAAPAAVQKSGQVEYFHYVYESGDKPSIQLDVDAIRPAEALPAQPQTTPEQSAAAEPVQGQGELSGYGLETPKKYVTATADGADSTIYVGSQTSDGRWYVLTPDGVVRLAAQADGEALSRSIYDMAVLPELPVITEKNLISLTLTGAEGKQVTFSVDESGVRKSGAQDVTEKTAELVAELGKLAVTACVDYDPADGAAAVCGLDVPEAILAVNYVNAHGGDGALTLTVGGSTGDGGRYVTLDGDTTIYRMEETALAQVLTLAALGLS